MRFLLLVLGVVGTGLLVAAEPAGDVLELDQWFVGDLNGQPAVSMHAVVTRRPSGTHTDALDMTVLIVRSLGGSTVRIEMRESQLYEEDEKGRIISFRFDHVENDMPTSAVGRIEGREVVSTVHRLGRTDDRRLPIPAGVELLGQQGGQDLLVRHGQWQAGEKQALTSLVLMGNQVQIVTMAAVFKQATAEGNLVFDMRMEMAPIPTTMTITPKGELVGMAMSLGFISLELRPSHGPVPLAGAELAPTGLVTAKGPAPAAGPVNRYRLPPGATINEDEFQKLEGGVVTVRAVATPSALADPQPFLRAEAQLELDDPELRAWVAALVEKHGGDQAELAEHLRLATRSRIVKRDLAIGDGSALEAFRKQEGDCTEHANLLCAALRIAGIPARVEVGLVYSPDYGGWVGHAWNSAYLGGRWTNLDSAYPGVSRSCYLAFGTTTAGEGKSTAAAMVGNLVTVMGKEIETLPQQDPVP
jgi:hypothetical protein